MELTETKKKGRGGFRARSGPKNKFGEEKVTRFFLTWPEDFCNEIRKKYGSRYSKQLFDIVKKELDGAKTQV